MQADEWVPLAEIARPHGVQGELRLRVFNADSALLLELDEVQVRFPNGETHEVSVDAARRASDAILMKLHSVDDRDRADALRGAIISVQRKQFPPLADGEFYACDVVGARVVREEDPAAVIGTVLEYRSYPSVSTFAVQLATGELEIPVTETFVASVDVAAGCVMVRALELLEI
jgi:16S rRNA processing protein RimM